MRSSLPRPTAASLRPSNYQVVPGRTSKERPVSARIDVLGAPPIQMNAIEVGRVGKNPVLSEDRPAGRLGDAISRPIQKMAPLSPSGG
jgi:hypothetical protein